MADTGDDCCLSLNPDITGIGVRVALYVQILLGWVVSYKWPDTFAKNARTAYMTAIALLIAAFIQWKTQQQLSLLDGIVVSLITTMMITFTIASSPTRSNTQNQPPPPGADPTDEVDPNKSFSRFLTQIFFIAFWAGWCLVMWKNPMHFGVKDPSCPINSFVTITLFGREIHATDPRMRRAAIALVSFGLVTAFLSLWISLEGLLGPLIKSRRNQVPKPGERRLGADGKPEDSILAWIRRFLQALSLGTLIFLIVATEQTISKNDRKHTANDWSYGQTIALILLLQQIMDVCSTFLEKKEEAKWESGSDKQSIQMTPVSSPPATQDAPAAMTQPTTQAATQTAATNLQPPQGHSPAPGPSPASSSVNINTTPAGTSKPVT